MKPITRETIVERRQTQMRWGAVLAGTVLSIGLWILLQVLGMGLGLSAVDTDNAGSLKGVGIGTGIWSLVAPLIAVFVGAMLVGRMSGALSRKVGALHGSVMWALSMIAGLWAVLALVTALASGAARIGGAAAQAGGAAISGAVSAGGKIDAGGAMSALGVDANDLLDPVNQRLQREGKPPVTAEQLNATLKSVAQQGLQQGRLDRELLVQELARNTNLSPADAQDIANDIEKRYQAARGKVGEAAQRAGETAKEAALTAADKTGKALLLGGVMMLLSLGAALGGGALGVPRWRERTDRTDRTEVTTTTLSGPGLMGS
jgi:hypothetical protein